MRLHCKVNLLWVWMGKNIVKHVQKGWILHPENTMLSLFCSSSLTIWAQINSDISIDLKYKNNLLAQFSNTSCLVFPPDYHMGFMWNGKLIRHAIWLQSYTSLYFLCWLGKVYFQQSCAKFIVVRITQCEKPVFHFWKFSSEKCLIQRYSVPSVLLQSFL